MSATGTAGVALPVITGLAALAGVALGYLGQWLLREQAIRARSGVPRTHHNDQ